MTILAKKIFQNEHLVFNLNGPTYLSVFTVEQINNTPTPCWLVRNPYCCGGDEELQLEFKKPASDINVIQGVWIQYGADGCMIDGSITDVVAKMGGCCGTGATVIQNYPTGLPAWQAPVAKTYTLTRTDDGSIQAQTDAELAYLKFLVPNSFSRTGYSAGVATYVFQAYQDPSPQGTDTIVETARVFTSNAHPTLSGANVYNISGVADGDAYHVKGTTTFGDLATLLNGDPILGTYGTWAIAGTTVTLTTKVKDVATLVLGQEAP